MSYLYNPTEKIMKNIPLLALLLLTGIAHAAQVAVQTQQKTKMPLIHFKYEYDYHS
jgi:hypothetical protein